MRNSEQQDPDPKLGARSIRIRVRYSLKPARKALIGCGAFVVIGGFIVSQGIQLNSLAQILFGATPILFFGGGGLVLIIRRLWPRPALVVDEDGIIDHSHGLSVGFVPWEEISAIGVVPYEGLSLAIYVHSTETLLARLSWYKRKGIEYNLQQGGPPILLPQQLIAEDVVTLADRIRDFAATRMQQHRSNDAKDP